MYLLGDTTASTSRILLFRIHRMSLFLKPEAARGGAGRRAWAVATHAHGPSSPISLARRAARLRWATLSASLPPMQKGSKSVHAPRATGLQQHQTWSSPHSGRAAASIPHAQVSCRSLGTEQHEAAPVPQQLHDQASICQVLSDKLRSHRISVDPQHLVPGRNLRGVCPSCHGGEKEEKSLCVMVNEDKVCGRRVELAAGLALALRHLDNLGAAARGVLHLSLACAALHPLASSLLHPPASSLPPSERRLHLPQSHLWVQGRRLRGRQPQGGQRQWVGERRGGCSRAQEDQFICSVAASGA